MGRGRNGPVNQSQRKLKARKDKDRGQAQWQRFGLTKHEKRLFKCYCKLCPQDLTNGILVLNES